MPATWQQAVTHRLNLQVADAQTDQPQPRVFLASWEHQDRRLYFDIEDKGLSLLE